MVNQCTKLEVSRFTRYEAINGSAKCIKWDNLGVVRGQSRSRAMPSFDRAHTISSLTLIETMCLSFTGYLSKVADFDPPHLHLVPRRRWLRSNFAEIFGVRKRHSLSYRVVLLFIVAFATVSHCRASLWWSISSGVTMGWLLRLMTGPTGGWGPNSCRVLSD